MKLLKHTEFFYKILDNEYEFSNEEEAEIFSNWKVGGQDIYIYAKRRKDKEKQNFTDDYLYCNHHHELDETYEVINFGNGEFVANKEGIPLLKALNTLGLETRTHHIKNDGEWAFFSILLNDDVEIEVNNINEKDASRTKYNGKKELLIRWNLAKHFKKANLPKEGIPVVAKLKTYENKIIFNIICYINGKWYIDKTGEKLSRFHNILEWKYLKECF